MFRRITGSIKCFFRGLWSFITIGEWVSHLYIQAVRPAIIISTKTGFRVSDNYVHSAEETVHPNGGFIIGQCIYCGKVCKAWCHDFDEYTSRNEEEVLGYAEISEDDIKFFDKDGKER